jgi:hypothetical protein
MILSWNHIYIKSPCCSTVVQFLAIYITFNLKPDSYFPLFVGGSTITLTNFTLMISGTNCLKVWSTIKFNCEPSNSPRLSLSTGQGHKSNQHKCTRGLAVLPDTWK